MSILEQLIHLMLAKVEVKPVPQAELDEFLMQNHLQLCEEYYQFLLQYGNSDFLKGGFADLRFEEFKDYTLYDEFPEELQLPENCSYVGMDFNDELLCIDNHDKKIYTFDYGEKYEKCYYGGLKGLLLYYLLNNIDVNSNKTFDSIQMNINIDDIEQFKQQYLAYEIKDIYIYNRYFFKEGKLIICDHQFYSYHLCQGGILDKVIV